MPASSPPRSRPAARQPSSESIPSGELTKQLHHSLRHLHLKNGALVSWGRAASTHDSAVFPLSLEACPDRTRNHYRKDSGRGLRNERQAFLRTVLLAALPPVWAGTGAVQANRCSCCPRS